MKYKLFKIVVDDRGIAGDGSDAKTHCELLFEGDESALREKMFALKILDTPLKRDNIPVECLSYFTAQKGFIIQKED